MRQLTKTEREELTRWSRSRTLAARDVFVALLILALDSGKSYTQIEREMNTSRPTIARWKARFEKDGMAGLETQASRQQAANCDARSAGQSTP